MINNRMNFTRRQGDISLAKKKNWTTIFLKTEDPNWIEIHNFIMQNCNRNEYRFNPVKKKQFFSRHPRTIGYKYWFKEEKLLTIMMLKFNWNPELEQMKNVRSMYERRITRKTT